MASINYDILYFIANDSYEDDDLDELPNQIIYADGIKAINLNYIKSEWQTDFDIECISNISVFREVMQNSYMGSPRLKQPSQIIQTRKSYGNHLSSALKFQERVRRM